MRLLLVRHAEAEERDSSKWPDDSQRPLSESGIKRFIKAARGAGKIVTPDVVLTSPYVRATHTAALLSEHANWPSSVEEPKIPGGKLAELVESVFNKNAETMAFVGHEPTLSEFVSTLTSGAPGAEIRMKTGSIACIDLHSTTSGELVWLATPKLLRAIAK